jgi:hypothetical protein
MKRLFCAIILFYACTAALHAQISAATLVGTVTDSSSAAVPGAVVEAKSNATSMARSAKTDSKGEYVIPDLPAAHYTLTITMNGFKTFVAPDVELLVAQRAMINATLEVGTVQQNLTVEGAAPMIDTASASVGQVVNTNSVDHMPLNGRSFWQLTDLTPGATYTPAGRLRTREEARSAPRWSMSISTAGLKMRRAGLSMAHLSPRCNPAAP